MATPFDDVFRTLATKRSEMLITVINEMFSLDYPEDAQISLKNDLHFLGGQKLETDSVFQVEKELFHIECQSEPDNTISIRIMEYSFITAVESARKKEDGIYHLHFPRSGLMMLRHNSNTPEAEKVCLHFADGDVKELTFRVLKVQDYTVDEIFEKKLYLLLPFYIMRYESILRLKGRDREAVKKQMMSEVEDILEQLQRKCVAHDSVDIYEDVRSSMEKISDHIFRNSVFKKEVKKVMRGRILELPSDKIRKAEKEAEARGEAIGEEKKEKAMTRDIQVIGPLLKEEKDDSMIAKETGWPEEKIAKYRKILSFML